jgi:hypothetical protein
MNSLTDKNKQFYSTLDSVFSTVKGFLDTYSQSEILQQFSIDLLRGLFYANQINLFFDNLTAHNLAELKLPPEKTEEIKTCYTDLRKNVALTLSGQVLVNEQTYKNFKANIKKNYPSFEIILDELEETVDLNYAEKYLDQKGIEFKATGRTDLERFSNDWIFTILLETFVKQKKCLPKKDDLRNLTEHLSEFVPTAPKNTKEPLENENKETLDDEGVGDELLNNQSNKVPEPEPPSAPVAEPQNNSDIQWKNGIDHLERLFKISAEAGGKQLGKLQSLPDYNTNLKYSALLKVHARTIQIANEILLLLKSGSTDGANARWRALYELSVVSFVLCENGSAVSERYIEHEVVKRYRNAKEYQADCELLGYSPPSKEQLEQLEKQAKAVCDKYTDNFAVDYGWIPSSILPKRSYREIEAYAKLNKLHPFYALSSDAVHSSSNGFFSMGLMPEKQPDVLVIGSRDYGLADLLQNSAISLGQINACLLALSPDFENILSMNIINLYTQEICTGVIRVHQLQKEIKAQSSK